MGVPRNTSYYDVSFSYRCVQMFCIVMLCILMQHKTYKFDQYINFIYNV